MNILVLFDGAGLARLGLESCGHICTGVELDPWKHYLSTLTGSGNCILEDVTKIDMSNYDAVWASPPCILRSVARHKDTKPRNELYSIDYVDWCLNIPKVWPNIKTLWVECTLSYKYNNKWGKLWNAAQFLEIPIQCRNRIIGGNYIDPKVFRPYKKFYKPDWNISPAILSTEYKCGRRRATQWHRKNGLCPAITATEARGCATDKRRASRHYGRRLSLEECAYHQGLPLEILERWKPIPKDWPYTPGKWTINLYEAIGNGVPPYMTKLFGEVYK